jgi:polar amino acid transport system substrate-binding protein
MPFSFCRRVLLLGAALAAVGGFGPAMAASTDVPQASASPIMAAIQKRGALRVAAIGEFPWLPENTTGSGPQYSGPAWMLAEEYAKRLGVPLQVVPVSHETKVPILATGDADISIAPLAVTPKRQAVVDFIVYSKSSLCFFGKADNPKLEGVQDVDGLNKDGLTMAYFSGTPPEAWAPGRFPKIKFRAVTGSGANAPVEEVMSGRADFASIDNVAWPQLEKQVPGLAVFPKGDGCLQSNEMATPVGLAVDKKDTAFRDWLQAVYDEVKDKVTAEEIRMLKEGA